MNCKKCGGVLSEGVTFCPNCGESVVVEVLAENTTVVENNGNVQAEPVVEIQVATPVVQQESVQQPMAEPTPVETISEVSNAPIITIVASENDEMENIMNASESNNIEQNKKKSPLGILLVLLILFGIGVAVYFLYINKTDEKPEVPEVKNEEVAKQSVEWLNQYLIDFTNVKFLENIDNFSSIQIMDFVTLHYMGTTNNSYCNTEVKTTVCNIPASEVKELVKKYFGIDNFIYETGQIDTVKLENDTYTIEYSGTIDNSVTFQNELVEYKDNNKTAIVSYKVTSNKINSIMKLHLKYVGENKYNITKIEIKEVVPTTPTDSASTTSPSTE